MTSFEYNNSVDTLIISDIHLGYDFSRTERLLDVITKFRYKQLILNGDIFDDLNFNRLHSDHWDVLSYIRQMTKERKVIWVVGNHDGQANILSRLLGIHIHNQYIWTSQGRRYLAIHGHQFDRFISKSVIISNLATWVYDIVRRFNKGENTFSRWMMENNRSWMRLSDEVARGAMEYGRSRGIDVVFCGHTHIARTVKDKDISYYNSGSWTETPSHLITVTGRKVELIVVD